MIYLRPEITKLPFLWSPVQVAVVHSTRRVHDLVHSSEELGVVALDSRLPLFLKLQKFYLYPV